MNTQEQQNEYSQEYHWGEMQHESKAVPAPVPQEIHIPIHVEESEPISSKTLLETIDVDKVRPKVWLKIVGGIIVLALIVAGYVWYMHHHSASSSAAVSASSDSASAVDGEDDAAVIDALKKIILTPDETPTVITIPSDMSMLAGNPFFAHAEPGDKVLVFEQAQEVFLFDPTLGKVLAAGPLEASLQPQATSTGEIGKKGNTMTQ